MNNLTKIPYEISLWDDRLTIVGKDGKEYSEFVDSSTVEVDTQYYKEYKLCAIGSNTMESPISVVEPSLVRKTDGTSTLTFSIYAKYYDEETGEFKENPFLKYLTNERKVKLKYYPNGELRWLDFIIKKIDESSESYKFTYTATDLFINELSKTGYNLEFDVELENNQGTIKEMADKVLARTDWMTGEDSELIRQTNDEPLYKIVLTANLWAKDIFTDEQVKLNTGEYVYTFYSTLQEETDPDFFQFIYDGKKEDENGKISHVVDENNVLQNVKYLYCSRESVKSDTPTYYKGVRGQKYIRRQETEYDKVLGEYVKVYKDSNDNTVYGYQKTEYFTPSLVTNFITNGNLILSNSGWDQETEGSLEVDGYPSVKETTFSSERAYGIKYNQNKDNTYLINSGFRDNAENIKEIVKGQQFVFRIRALDGNGASKSGFTIKVSKAKRNENGELVKIKGSNLFSGTASNSIIENGKTYYYTTLSAMHAVSYEELTDITNPEKYYIFISAPGSGEYLIQHAELFIQSSGKSSVDKSHPTSVEGIILPSGKVMSTSTVSETIAESYAKTTYYYYNKAETEFKTKPEQIEYRFIGDEPQNNTYKPSYDSNFEKVRSISKKESNRFDLLQTLSETFECWCRFDVWHRETGEIMLGRDLENLMFKAGGTSQSEQVIFLGGNSYSLEDYQIFSDGAHSSKYGPYQQLKFVTFHNQIGQKKSIGFRYGTNLKSISRSLDSNNIATKLIVKSNTNEFANGGSCNIALAKENPSGENFIYDFTYYINHGLMNETNLARDLYYAPGEQGWNGLFVQLKAKNKNRDALITELTSCTKEYARNKSTFESAKLLWNASQDELERLKDEYFDITGESYSDSKKKGEIAEGYEDDDKVNGIIYNIDLLIPKITQAESDYNNANSELGALNKRIEDINKDLKAIEEYTANLISDFEKKYIRFIQEASWTSEEYIDDNLYYLDAETTLHKASQPKVSYTINVIELSQLEEYKNYVFDLGDITYIQDPDFFGWKDGGPYKEEIVITEMQTFFHSPEKSTIKVQNYRTSFEDLFKRLTASAQQVHFHSGEFQRAADIVDANGNIAPSCLEDAFSNNAYVLSNVANQTVKMDEFGITTTNDLNPAEILRITSGGMFLSNNGGDKWTTGITANGINAKVITTGQLDTGKINIFNGNQKSFAWDSQGLNAYRQNENGGYNPNKFVRFNQYGIFGVESASGKDFSSVDSIKNNASFYLGWDGLHLNSGYLNISNGSNSVVINPNGLGTDNDNKIFEVKKDNEVVMSITTDGDATFSGKLDAATGLFKGELNVNDKFIVDSNGNVTLNGNITWGTSASPTQVVYARTAISKPANGTKYSSFSDSSSTTWHKTFNTTYDKYASYTYDGGKTWGNVVQIVGTKGENGKGISKTEIRYAKSTNGTTAPTSASDWKTTIPTIASNEYLWTRTIITYTDGDTSTSYSVGSKGAKGETGTSITIEFIKYASHSNNSTPPGASSTRWKTTIGDATTSGTYPYLWSWVKYSDDRNLYTCLKGTVTKEELWGFLGDDDGIYENDQGNIAIRATAVIAGGLQVGGTAGDPTSSGTKFYAGGDSNSVYIGGWRVGTVDKGWHVSDSNTTYTNSLYTTLKNGEVEYLTFIRSGGSQASDTFAVRSRVPTTDSSKGNGTHIVTTYFSLTKEGALYAKKATIEGTITATSGEIGSWTIANTGLQCKVGSTLKMFLSATEQQTGHSVGSSGSRKDWAIWSKSGDNGFGVTQGGVLYATGANISGVITATGGKIGGWTIDDEALTFDEETTYDYVYSSETSAVIKLSKYSIKANEFSMTKKGITYKTTITKTSSIEAINQSDKYVYTWFDNEAQLLEHYGASSTGETEIFVPWTRIGSLRVGKKNWE